MHTMHLPTDDDRLIYSLSHEALVFFCEEREWLFTLDRDQETDGYILMIYTNFADLKSSFWHVFDTHVMAKFVANTIMNDPKFGADDLDYLFEI